MQNHDHEFQRRIYSVSELNANIKSVIEESFPFVWLYGEISNFRVPVSGHYYFTLKDAASQINAVLFRAQQRHLKFEPEDGMSVTGMGRISVYEPRGTYQFIVEYLEPSGIGTLQIAFEKLKKRLAEEGIFESEHKRALPFLPNKISVITSPTGAIVHDILKIVNRRFPNVCVRIIPAKVQGHGAVEEIVSALELLNTLGDSDVAILARGGGSLEDLQAFNSEPVARAIFDSKVPIVSAVGHETDYTISDFVADLRAPTPSAAAELVVPKKAELQHRCQEILSGLEYKYNNYFKYLQIKLSKLTDRLADPRRKIDDFRLKTDDLAARLNRSLVFRIRREQNQLGFWKDRLAANSPKLIVEKFKRQLENSYINLLKSYIIFIKSRKGDNRELTARLKALSPVAILERGYSITRTIPKAVVVRDSDSVSLDQELEVLVARGRLICRVKGKSTDGEENF